MTNDFKFVRITALVTGLATIVLAFVHGYNLISTRFGVLFGLLSAGALGVAYRCLTRQGKYSIVYRTFGALFSLIVITLIAFPDRWCGDWFANLVEESRLERYYQPRLNTLIANDRRFNFVTVRMEDSKGFRVLLVGGFVKSGRERHELKEIILEAFPELEDMNYSCSVKVIDYVDFNEPEKKQTRTN